ncbi:MAG: peptidoglycan binding protein CsiV [Gammaproteobacteria bacterium]|nr:peptidoglycan binding protein CsiV [Gammaproteobacteria bacterium]
MKRIVHILLVGMLVVSAAWAQDIAYGAQAEERRYAVEVIIFTYTRDVETAGEMFVPDPAIEEQFPGVIGDSAALGALPGEPTEPLPAIEFVRLDPGDYTMDDIMGHLRRIDIYRPVMHFGWVQTTLPDELTRSIQLASLARPASGLDGTLRLYLSRFLHLVVELEMEAGQTDVPGIVDTSAPVYYRIQENRIFRSGELRYFDHPKFGVLAKVTRVES